MNEPFLPTRRRWRAARAWAAALLACSTATASVDWSANCRRLRCLPLPHAAIDAVTLESPQILPGTATARSAGEKITVSFCRVRGTIRPSLTSDIAFEVWLPLSGWNGDLNQVGNGGLAGVIPYSEMPEPLEKGYAVAATDDGTDPRSTAWLRDPERVIDYCYRSVHETRLQAAAIVQAFYGQPLREAYFTGGSKGGQEALMEAHRYPEDFIGIAAWAPAANFTHFLAHVIWCARAVDRSPASSLPEDKLMVLHRAVLAGWAGKDGGLASDPYLTNPAICHFLPDGLLCRGTDSSGCLTSAQILAAKTIYSDVHNPRTGELISRGLLPGSEAPVAPISSSGHGWSRFLADAKRYAQPVLGDAVFGNPNWDWHSFDFDRDMALADRKLGSILNSSNPDLRAFKARGGKLLITHGWDDSAVPAGWSIDFFRSVVADQAAARDRPRNRSALAETQTFLRLFMIPGQGHGYGFGPSEVSQIEVISGWVEKGRVPERIIATQYVNDDPGRGVAATRPLFPYPQTTAYTGSGDPTKAENFACLPHPFQSRPRRE